MPNPVKDPRAERVIKRLRVFMFGWVHYLDHCEGSVSRGSVGFDSQIRDWLLAVISILLRGTW